MTNATRKPENQEMKGQSEKKGFGREEPLGNGRFGTISKGFKERIMRNLRDAAIAASLRFGSIKGVPESPIAAKIDGGKGGKEMDGPVDVAEDKILTFSREDDGFVRCMRLDEEPFRGERTSAILNVGEGVSTTRELSVTLMRIEMKDGEYVAKVAVSAPWLEGVTYADVKDGECVVVPSIEAPAAVIVVRSIEPNVLCRVDSTIQIEIVE
ncbi:hypothetical protein H0O01_02240 [Candidatus Micrarchaeota archaeon]|nr:hypothetical protein [Candidatus Micrarchaeota archaeon]